MNTYFTYQFLNLLEQECFEQLPFYNGGEDNMKT